MVAYFFEKEGIYEIWGNAPYMGFLEIQSRFIRNQNILICLRCTLEEFSDICPILYS